MPHAPHRQFSNADKRRILDAADRCTRPGEAGALMRREGVYSFSLSTWRRQCEAGDLAALAPQKRGPKIPVNRDETLKIAQFTRERDGLKRERDKAMLAIGVQEKLATLLDTLNNDNSEKPFRQRPTCRSIFSRWFSDRRRPRCLACLIAPVR